MSEINNDLMNEVAAVGVRATTIRATASSSTDAIFVREQHIIDFDGEKGTYTGALNRVTNMPNGKGRLEYEKESRWYDGDWIHGRWTGYGRLANGNGDVYEGGLKNDYRHGTGIMKFADGRVFEGDYIRGHRIQGKMTYQDGSVYDGSWVDGLRHGRGKCVFVDGSEYEGEFREDNFQGRGKLTWNDGGGYVGICKGRFHKGTFYGFDNENDSDNTCSYILRDGEWSRGLPPILNSVTGEVFSTVICSQFLLPEDIAALLQVDEIFNVHEQLRTRYCKLHGTKFDETYEDAVERRRSSCYRRLGNRQHETAATTTPSRNVDGKCGGDNNSQYDDEDDINDLSFLIHALEQQKFILADPLSSSSRIIVNDEECSNDDDNKLPSLSPNCLICRMARYHSKKKCPCCDTFVHHKLFHESSVCEGSCKKTVCDNCGWNSCDEQNCHDNGIYCKNCFDGFRCEICSSQYHNACAQLETCNACGINSCRHCVDNGYR